MTEGLEPYAQFKMLLFDRPAPWVLRVTINNPDQLNALNGELGEEMERVWTVVDGDPLTRVAIVTGAGRAFSSGGALDAMPTRGDQDHLDDFCRNFGSTRGLVSALINMRKPLVSAINGYAIGAGLACARS